MLRLHLSSPVYTVERSCTFHYHTYGRQCVLYIPTAGFCGLAVLSCGHFPHFKFPSLVQEYLAGAYDHSFMTL